MLRFECQGIVVKDEGAKQCWSVVGGTTILRCDSVFTHPCLPHSWVVMMGNSLSNTGIAGKPTICIEPEDERCPLVSIVCPVYNAAEHLGRTLQSFANQAYPNLEIILVDDGSTDSSPIILDGFAIGHHNAKVIHQRNKGVSSSRNIGIEAASGEYLCFVDSDDIILDDAITSLVGFATNNNADIVVTSIIEAREDGTPIGVMKAPEKSLGLHVGLVSPLQAGAPLYTHNHFFKRSILGNLWFDNGLSLLEDRLFVAMAYRKARRVLFVDEAFYKYIQRPDSIVHANFSVNDAKAVRVDKELMDYDLALGYVNPGYKLFAARSVSVILNVAGTDLRNPWFRLIKCQLLEYDQFSSTLTGWFRLKYLAVKNLPEKMLALLFRARSGKSRL